MIESGSVKKEHLNLLAEVRVLLENDPSYMAYMLELYRIESGLDDESIAGELQASLATLVRLSLCKCPDASSQEFEKHLSRISAYTGIDQGRLSSFIKRTYGYRCRADLNREKKSISHINLTWAAAVKSHYRNLDVVLRKIYPILASLLIVTLSYVLFVSLRDQQSGDEVTRIEQRDAERPALQGISEINQDETRSSSLLVVRPQGAPEIYRGVKSGARKRAGTYSLTIDLDEYRVVRLMQSGEEGSKKTKPIELPQLSVRISFKLREGSIIGSYSVSVVDAFNKPLTETKAKSTDGKSLTIILDASRLEEKAYRLCISREGEAPQYYPIVIKAAKAVRSSVLNRKQD